MLSFARYVRLEWNTTRRGMLLWYMYVRYSYDVYMVAALRIVAHTKLEYIKNTNPKLNMEQCAESSNLKLRYLY